MNFQLVSYTQPNPALTAEALVTFGGDLAMLFKPSRPFAENLIEYAARVCYNSTERMGSAPGFLAGIIKSRHFDVLEHAWATVLVNGYKDSFITGRFWETSAHDDGWLVSANLRTWREFFFDDKVTPPYIKYFLSKKIEPIAPRVFGESYPPIAALPPSVAQLYPATPEQRGPMRVALLAYSQPGFFQPLQHGSATFLFEGVSRSLTHQHVRSRIASHSQESQRYVDLAKGGWSVVVPPTIAANSLAITVLADLWQHSEDAYAELRRLGIPKEDARYLLPNATETRIVTTMNYAAWLHFFWLRAADKAAQWEIRQAAQMALRQLYAVAPDVFGEVWAKAQEVPA